MVYGRGLNKSGALRSARDRHLVKWLSGPAPRRGPSGALPFYVVGAHCGGSMNAAEPELADLRKTVRIPRGAAEVNAGSLART